LSSEKDNLKLLVEKAERKVAESLKGLASMENDIKLLSSEKQTVENERDNLKMTVADMEEERAVLCNQLKDTVDKCTFLSSELEKARLAEKEMQTLLAENQKLKNDKLILSSESDNLKARLQTLGVNCSKLKPSILETKAENESLLREKHIVESRPEELVKELDGLKVEKENLVNSLNEEFGTAVEKTQPVGE
jgi:predicted  nucleic acid-binding Zn-ribbon protein